jgi:catechol 2,3-dioxygenase-like lactoylglutathione lyase family enzyme
MMIGVLHFSFTVSDIDKSVKWYTDVLGLELVNRQRQNNEYTKKLVGMPDAILEVARLCIPGVRHGASDHILELVQYVVASGPVVPLETNSPGIAHFAFLVDDILDRHKKLSGHGVSFRNPPVTITEGTNRGGMACYFHGPDGETLELLQPSPERLDQINREMSVS